MPKKTKNVNSLTDSEILECRIQETTEGSKLKYEISGPFMKPDVPTRNGRIYPKEVANKAVEKLRKRISTGTVNMLCDHPDMFEYPSIRKVGAILKEITETQADGYCYYKAQIVDTAVGKDLKAIIDAGGKVGVSTRGYDPTPKMEQEWPNLPGKWTVMSENFELESIDFVDDPAVLDTETFVHVENNQRSEPEMKTLEELRKEYPEAFESMDSKISKIISDIKEYTPESFTVISESDVLKSKDMEIKKLQEAKDSEVKTLTETIETLKKELEEFKKAVESHNSEKIKLQKENEIDKIKAEDCEFFKFKVFENAFANCITAEEVRSVYTEKKAIMDELRQHQTSVSTPKTESKVPDTLTEAQVADFNKRNKDRRLAGLTEMSQADYIRDFVKKA